MKAVFLDRDGIINRKPQEGSYVTAWDEFKFLRNAIKAIRYLNKLDFLVIVVTNQRGVALGHLTEERLKEIHQKMLNKITSRGAHIDAIYYCPHDKDTCSCRKPEIGLFLKAKKDFPEIDFRNSFVVGDSENDIKAGKRLGCKTILIVKDPKKLKLPENILPDFITTSLWQAYIKIRTLISKKNNK